jgi:XRE family transcriptional regulator
MQRKKINRLKVFLAQKGMTNKQQAEILDKEPTVISKWVTNVAQPNVD